MQLKLQKMHIFAHRFESILIIWLSLHVYWLFPSTLSLDILFDTRVGCQCSMLIVEDF